MKVLISNIDKKWEENDISSFPQLKELEKVDIVIDSSKVFQSHLGFGGAFTDATTVNYLSLSPSKRKEVINALFSKNGLNYNLGRYHIQSCDFSPFSYTYVEDEDLSFKTFSLKKDKERIAFTKECLALRNDVIMFSAPWSPLPFLKDNKDYCHGGHLEQKHYQNWANFLVFCLKEYEKEGLHIDVISTQNEPAATQVWESCLYSAKEEALFVKDYLLPAIKQNGLKTKISIWDHNRDIIVDRVKDTMNNLNESDVYAIAYHWYDHKDFKELSKIHELYPNTHLLLTECCVELGIYKDGIGNLNHAEMYAHEMINDLNNYSEGYIDWNMILDIKGGPNHVGNYCEAPIMVNNGDIIYLPTYYYIGHFSKFINRGDQRIFSSSSDENIEIVAYKSGEKVVSIILNKGNSDKNIDILFNNKSIKFALLAHSICTLVI